MVRNNKVLPSGNEPEQSVFQRIAPFLTTGTQLALTVVVFFFIGRWLDEKFGSTPWCIIVLTMIGIGGGLYKFLRTAIAFGKEEDEKWKAEKSDRKESRIHFPPK